MRTIKHLIFLLVTLVITQHAMAQQQGQYSQYMMNYYLINPGVAGTEDYMDIRAGYRMQWTSLSGAPRNFYVSAHMPINKPRSKMKYSRKKAEPYHVMGGLVTGQKLGAFSHSTAMISYAYHLPLDKHYTLSMGLMGGINQFTIDADALNWGDNVADPSTGGMTSLNPDLAAGLWLYSEHMFVGLSGMQLLGSKVDFSPGMMGAGSLSRHMYLTGGYKIKMNEDLSLVPSVLVKVTSTAWQVDLNAKLRYRNMAWAGLSYRRTDAVVFLLGATFWNRLDVGYSYDFNTSKLNQFNGGSHEIMVGFKLQIKGRMMCPSDFW